MTLHRHCDGPACDSHQHTNSALKQDWLELRVVATEVTEELLLRAVPRRQARPPEPHDWTEPVSYRRLIEEAGLDWIRASIHRTGGPERVFYNDQPDPNFKPRPVGFLTQIPAEPMIWEGDNA